MAVITTDGLIGNILAVTPTTAQVLLTDSRRGVAVAAMVQRSREPGEVGVVENDPQEPGSLRIKDLPREANILPAIPLFLPAWAEFSQRALLSVMFWRQVWMNLV